MTSKLIEVNNLSRTFKTPINKGGLLSALSSLFHREHKTIEAVKGLNFSIDSGEAIGFIGPNGAGKSTTVKMLTGILTPSSGKLTVAGYIPSRQRQQLARNIGVVFGQRTQLWWDLPVIESFHLLSHIYQVSRQDYDERLDKLTSLLDMNEFLQIPVRKLSLGQRMRADLAASLLHDPPILFLDEPTIGLDVAAKYAIREFLRYIINEHKKTLLLTTHDLTDIEVICPRLMIIDHGKLLFDGSLEELRNKYLKSSKITIETEDQQQLIQLIPKDVVYERQGTDRLLIHLPRNILTPAQFLEKALKTIRVHEVKVEESDIEDVVRLIYKQGLVK